MVQRTDVLIPEAYKGYVAAAGSDDLSTALKKSAKQFRKLCKNLPKKKIDYAYAEGKWTVRELVQHVIDAERVFVSRALWFARRDTTPLPGFDENTWTVTSNASAREWEELIEEFKVLRASTKFFFDSLNDQQLLSNGTANNNQMNVAGLGFVCAGHVCHHINIIKERYLPKKKKTVGV